MLGGGGAYKRYEKFWKMTFKDVVRGGIVKENHCDLTFQSAFIACCISI